MSKYKRRKYINNSKKDYKSIILTLFSALLLFGVIGGVVVLIPNLHTSDEIIEYKTLYLVPSSSWLEDGSVMGAWCWDDDRIPAAQFVLASDDDQDGVYEVNVNTEYKSILFVDLNPGTTQLGADWSNKREQTDNLIIPSDDNIYYHQYNNEWRDNSDLVYTVTTTDIMVHLECENWSCTVKPVIYYFDKTGVNEPGFINMVQTNEYHYAGTVPAGYTHLIFIEYSSEESIGSWDNIINQTSDLIIPSDSSQYYNIETNEWYVPILE